MTPVRRIAAAYFSLFLACLVADASMPIRDWSPQAPEAYKVTLRKIEDVDKITVVLAKKERSFILSNVLPIARWPDDESKDAKKFKAEALKFLKTKMDGKELVFHRGHLKCEDGDNLRGDLIRIFAQEWPGGTPAGNYGWGMTYLNALMIQEGHSVYLPDDTVVLGFHFAGEVRDQKKRLDMLHEAERYAEKNRKGIWQDRDYALRVKAAASRPAQKKEK